MFLKKFLFGLFFVSLNFIVLAKPPIVRTKDYSNPPKKVIRICCAFGNNVKVAYIPLLRKTDITSVASLGKHSYLGGKKEGNGIIYTKNGGFIDVGHLRDYIDWTAYFYMLIMDSHQKGLNQKTIQLEKEGGKREITLHIPENIKNIDVYQWAARIAYDVSLWHEIATWFGFSYIPILVPEKFSSFSPEDLYSNLLGVHIGMQALKSDLPYEEAATKILHETLQQLDAVKTVKETREAMDQTAGDWWNKKKAMPFNSLTLKRLYDSECITPWLIDTYSPSFASTLCKPDACYRDMYEFKMELHSRFNKKDLGIDKSGYITQHHFPMLIKYIEENEKKKK